MKYLLLAFCFFILLSDSFSQNITGTWSGLLKAGAVELRIVFNIGQTDSGYTSTMDSPDQGVKGISVGSTVFSDHKLIIVADKLRMKYEGLMKSDSLLNGSFTQNGMTFPLEMKRGLIEKVVRKRPQEPVKPYSYYSEDVRFFNNKDSVTLAGTLTLPKQDRVVPAVILISGSGPQNRDEELMGHRPFLVLSDYLTRNGIAVLRFDDRGMGYSTGKFSTATSFDFSKDVESAFEYLLTRKEINTNKIGLVGHSEGGIIAPMVAARNSKVGFVVMLAGTGLPGDKVLLKQGELLLKVNGASSKEISNTNSINKKIYKKIKRSENEALLIDELTGILKDEIKKDSGVLKSSGLSADDFIQSSLRELVSRWFVYFIKYNPAISLTQLTCPVLALNGDKDLQVYSKDNLPAIERALKKGKNKNYSVKEISGVNHLFQNCKTGAVSEYSEIEETMSPLVLEELLNWITIQAQ